MKHMKQIQSHLMVSGTLTDVSVTGLVIAFCAISNNGDLDYAQHIFNYLPNRSAFIWNTMIRAYSERNKPIKAMSMYKQMLGFGVFSPNNYTFSFVIKACTELTDGLCGCQVHSQIVRLGWESYDFVQNGLIHMYVNCDSIDYARKLFDSSLYRDVISWTAMVNGYVKTGELEIARGLFDEMPVRNSVSWSAIITGYVQKGLFKEALELFNEMQLEGFKPNYAGIVGALTACGSLGALDQGRWIHAYVDRNGLELNRILGTALVDMYAKCGCIETAQQVFNDMPDRDVFAFTSMISGLSNHDKSGKAIELFLKMRDEGVQPNEVTFICVLSACSRMGLVEEGLDFFRSMNRVYGVEPGVEHYGCMVDLLGRAGRLEDAKKMVSEMPMIPDSYVLGALLNACRMHGEVELGKETVENLANLSLDHGGVHVLLSNIYASVNQWEDVAKVRKEMENKNVKKVPGGSSIELDGVVCEFVAGDRSHRLMEDIVSILLLINNQLRSLHFDDELVFE
ncbi:hypothetical protein MKW94_014358 [Papaver nudicaule]|uniref:Pentatricopeptide repeat-containing protein n=1 Tax=Papaver nudicaule TaxID=74823 RepID=A0AA41VU14_PAPNU|nr:hypothetical protein [Papaver nudicaule]